MATAIPYYLVWREDGPSPSVRQPDFDTASAEAERLARANPGVAFIVLAPVERVQRSDVQRIRFFDPDDAIPF